MNNIYIAELEALASSFHVLMNNIVETYVCLEKAEKMFLNVFETIVHPQMAKLLLTKADLTDRIIVLLAEYIEIIMNEARPVLNITDIYFLVEQIIVENFELISIFDKYRQIGIVQFLNENILAFLASQ